MSPAYRSGWPGLVLATLTVIASTPLAWSAQPNAKLLTAVKECEPGARSLLERVVAIDSGTGDVQGLSAVGAIYAAELRAMGAEVKTVSPTPPVVGDIVVATLTGRGKGRITLMSHMDTVFNRGDVAKVRPHWDGQHYVGPGAGDDKSGGVAAVCALKALHSTGFTDFATINVLLNSNEETGSIGTHDLIVTLAKSSDLVINLERGVPPDKVLVARKGSGVLTFEFKGRAAHSGLEPEKGRNAVLEAARVALMLGPLADPAKQTTVNVDILAGGDRTNVIPDHAVLKADVRAFSKEEFDRIEKEAARIAANPGTEGVTASSSLSRSFPPWPHLASADAALARANRLYGELGRTLTPTEVGSSADVSYAAETGTPSLDAFGIEGDGAHTPGDYADFASFTPRVYLLARMLMDFGHEPRLTAH
ncbi:MAG TPA: glutamate carboxypeptidase [Steroidobacteraceae bacterium]